MASHKERVSLPLSRSTPIDARENTTPKTSTSAKTNKNGAATSPQATLPKSNSERRRLCSDTGSASGRAGTHRSRGVTKARPALRPKSSSTKQGVRRLAGTPVQLLGPVAGDGRRDRLSDTPPQSPLESPPGSQSSAATECDEEGHRPEPRDNIRFPGWSKADADFTALNYMARQPHITDNMRAQLVDWLVEVHGEFQLRPETLFLAVSILDRYLSTTAVMRAELQLVGITALMIASKYEEIHSLPIESCVLVCDYEYKSKHVVRAEIVMLTALDFKLTYPTSYAFLLNTLEACGLLTDSHQSKQLLLHCLYALENTLTEYKFQIQPMSKMAAAAILLAVSVMDSCDWTPALEQLVGYSRAELQGLADEMKQLAHTSTKPDTKLRAVYNKYKMLHTIMLWNEAGTARSES